MGRPLSEDDEVEGVVRVEPRVFAVAQVALHAAVDEVTAGDELVLELGGDPDTLAGGQPVPGAARAFTGVSKVKIPSPSALASTNPIPRTSASSTTSISARIRIGSPCSTLVARSPASSSIQASSRRTPSPLLSGASAPASPPSSKFSRRYCRAISFGSPIPWILPSLISIARWQ